MMRTDETVRPFGVRDKLGYMFGDFGNDFTFIFAGSFLMVFYTKVLGINPGAVGVLFLLARFVDAVTDITMGRIVDAARPVKDGKFKPWIRRMCGPVVIASFLMYQAGMAGASMTVKMIYMYVTYLLWGSIFYTSINIPYGSMASAISNQPDDRASLSTFRSVGASLAGLVIGVGVPMVLYARDAAGNQVVVPERFTLIAGAFSAFALICYLLCYFMTAERVKVDRDPKKPRITLGQTASALIQNRALMAIIVAAIMLLLSQLVGQAMNNYLFADYFKDAKALSAINFLGTATVLALAPFTVKLTTRYGKKEAGTAAVLVSAAMYALLFFLRVKNPYTFCLIAIPAFLGQGFFNLIVWAFITDVIDFQEVKTNNREDGTVYAVYSFARKIGQALAGGIGGFALDLIGYDSLAAAQTEAVTNGIYSVATLVPAASFFVVALVLQFWYPLSRKVVEENTATLRSRRG